MLQSFVTCLPRPIPPIHYHPSTTCKFKDVFRGKDNQNGGGSKTTKNDLKTIFPRNKTMLVVVSGG